MADGKLITFASMPEGHGGTFAFDPIRYPPRIGTYGLIYSVGVYLPLPNNRSFVAHISAGVKQEVDPKQKFVPREKPDPKVPQPSQPKPLHINFYQYTTIKKAVYERLRAHAKSNGWTVQDVISAAKGSKRAYAMCPLHSDASRAIIDGIQEFLGFGGNFTLHINDDTVQGFYVEVQTGMVQSVKQKWDVNWGGQRVKVKGGELEWVGSGQEAKKLNPVPGLVMRKEWWFEIE